MFVAYLGIGSVLLVGFTLGFIAGRYAFKKLVATKYQDNAMRENRALHAQHREDFKAYTNAMARIARQKAQMAELTSHLAKAIEALK
jgi:uncharacterized membrane-anchored protein YhcB (DUF1043 family)